MALAITYESRMLHCEKFLAMREEMANHFAGYAMDAAFDQMPYDPI